ncbi:hypothetical protein A2Y83_05425 [Candidatus Falkowbacteria bacterium RBG_13_39_14]|uniref:N-acetyltransferase domain-containing protein n=1 Tax=Candidatus Falkowbacteria bacterium RBG_13_39_14 TaxID=1797985 RepID=A0A1F5S4D7_9BACT|nr:MAG: hypothetical protein A2Y83_05425 [Candidatus Falkowbacteria bacterium RBG_13_39_14]
MIKKIDHGRIFFRSEFGEEDKFSIARITSSSQCFSEKEVCVAVELIEERFVKGERSGYYFIFAEYPIEEKSGVLGYVCYGPDAGVEGSSSFHIYWIAVDNEYRNFGIGRFLLCEAEKAIKDKGGKHIYIETSSRDIYIPARAFYEKNGYLKEAVLRDFYGQGDDKVIYSKKIK